MDSFHQGGSERQALQLARLLREDGEYNVHLACLSGEGSLRAEAERSGFVSVPEYPLSSFYDRNAFVQVRRLASDLRTGKIDVIHTHDFYTNIFGMAAAKLARVRVRIASRRESAKRSLNKRRLERVAYRFAHAVVANCLEVRRQLIELEGVSQKKIVTLYNGLDLNRFPLSETLPRGEILKTFNLPVTTLPKVVTIVANLRSPVKDQATFLRAAGRIHKIIPDAIYVLAGEGKLIESMREMAVGLGLERQVYFLGRCVRVAELLAVSDVCVLSSVSEGFSNSILEYMAAARPVVATDVGGAREAIVEGETGYLVAAGDDEKMAARITDLLLEPELARRYGQKGREVVESKFSTSVQLARAKQLYDSLLPQAGLNLVETRSGTRAEAS